MCNPYANNNTTNISQISKKYKTYQINKIYKMNAKYQAAAGVAPRDRAAWGGPASAWYFVGVSCISWIYFLKQVFTFKGSSYIILRTGIV